MVVSSAMLLAAVCLAVASGLPLSGSNGCGPLDHNFKTCQSYHAACGISLPSDPKASLQFISTPQDDVGDTGSLYVAIQATLNETDSVVLQFYSPDNVFAVNETAVPQCMYLQPHKIVVDQPCPAEYSNYRVQFEEKAAFMVTGIVGSVFNAGFKMVTVDVPGFWCGSDINPCSSFPGPFTKCT
eukprot:CAMPEP_0114553438 /NCGR_PEP_ID=MMETSP0114-20121206/7662_1 /TAXON_ID=31324 /ORGANISM="Goniomonas sp, Strain m" /LENGTH=183 /DNA_ID=CAMNT_0001738389 /DNA_START=12 /DNA_END=563 /DNA_ORIENTATION=+